MRVTYDHDEIKKELARRKFKNFIQYTKPEYQFNWHHDHLIQKLQDFAEGKIKRLMIFMPPRHGKSEVASRRLPAWIFGRNPKARIICATYAAELAQSFNRDVQRVIDEHRYSAVFKETTLNRGNVRSDSTQSWIRNNDVFEIVKHGGMYRCAGVGGAITGTGGDFLIIDDPFKNYEEAMSPTIRRKVWEWYTSTFYTRQEKDAGIMIIQTRWHEDDLSGTLLDQQKKGGEFSDQWEVVNFPAILEKETEGDPRQVGDALWPEKYDEKFLKIAKHTMGASQFSALYQQTPAPSEGQVIKAKWLKRYDHAPELTRTSEILQSWDMSFGSVSDSASFVVGSVYHKIGSQVYLIDQVRGQWDFTETVAQVRALTAKWPVATRKLIEKKANGQAVIDTVSNEIQGIIPILPDASKESRLIACQPIYEAGNVLYPQSSDAPWVDDHIAEMLSFPNAKHDDRVDAESQALNYWRDGVIGKMTEEMSELISANFDSKENRW